MKLLPEQPNTFVSIRCNFSSILYFHRELKIDTMMDNTDVNIHWMITYVFSEMLVTRLLVKPNGLCYSSLLVWYLNGL